MIINKDIKDFYIKHEDNVKYSSETFFTSTENEMIINKMEMILSTQKGDYIADPNLGANLYFYLWSTNASASRIESTIKEQFSIYIPELPQSQYTVDVSIIEGEIRDIMQIDIHFNGSSNIYTIA